MVGGVTDTGSAPNLIKTTETRHSADERAQFRVQMQAADDLEQEADVDPSGYEADDSDGGGAVAHELDREPEPAASGSGASETDSVVGESTHHETDRNGQHPVALPGPVARCSRCTEMLFCCTCI